MNNCLDELSAIAEDCLCEKFSLCDFTKHYDKLFSQYRNDKFNLLEIGVFNGQSMRMWERYFPNAEIFGIDIDDACLDMGSDRSHIYIMNQSNKEELGALCDYAGEFFIACDDGSHAYKDMIASFDVVYPYVKKGGFYIIEDILPACKEPIYKRIEGLKVVSKAVSRYRPEIDMVIIQKE